MVISADGLVTIPASRQGDICISYPINMANIPDKNPSCCGQPDIKDEESAADGYTPHDSSSRERIFRVHWGGEMLYFRN